MSKKNIFDGENISCYVDENQTAMVVFDNKSASVNKFNFKTIDELSKVLDLLENQTKLQGAIFSSAKDVFIVGADITEFTHLFSEEESKLKSWLQQTHRVFKKLEDLPYPTVCAINGICLGGGFEFALCSAFRVATPEAIIGLPETKLGIIPGWGGTVRLPRLIGADNAIEWIASGAQNDAKTAFVVGAVDCIVEKDKLLSSAKLIIDQCNGGDFSYQSKQQTKRDPLKFLSVIESVMVFEMAKSFVAQQAGKHYPAPLEAVKAMQASAGLSQEKASIIEIDAFAKVAKTSCAENLVSLFLIDQQNKKVAKNATKKQQPTKKTAVLGAGIMGGGIAYQSASKKVPIIMKDIRQEALALGMGEAQKLLQGQFERKKIDLPKLTKILGSITPQLSFEGFDQPDVIVEAVVENSEIKKQVLKEAENHIRPDAVLASNTSTISITALAKELKRPDKFCGMHFFNPVHKMPLVEIIRGEKTSEDTIEKVLNYAMAIGKTPIVVNDCAGFLVNRVLFPYFMGFESLLSSGVAITRIDKIMESWGWPMGPAYLLDVIGIDTAYHARSVMAQAFPDRMQVSSKNALNYLFEQKRFGQKNNKGFYQYSLNKKGKPEKNIDDVVLQALSNLASKKVELSDEDIVDRMMIPMIHEAFRCLEEKIVDHAYEVDIGVIYGLGFPPFRGGLMKYVDQLGLDYIQKRSKEFQSYGACYQATPLLDSMILEKKKFYSPA